MTLPIPPRRCAYDFCHEFTPESHNAIYCPDCRCKRRAENSRKRLTVPVMPYGPEQWELQEQRKSATAAHAQAKNDYLLNNKRLGFFDIEIGRASCRERVCSTV